MLMRPRAVTQEWLILWLKKLETTDELRGTPIKAWERFGGFLALCIWPWLWTRVCINVQAVAKGPSTCG